MSVLTLGDSAPRSPAGGGRPTGNAGHHVVRRKRVAG